MHANVIAFVLCMGLCLVAGLYVYGSGKLSSEQVNRTFGNVMVAGVVCNMLIKGLHLLLPQPLIVVCGFMTATGFMGLITDGVIFKFWKVGQRSSMTAPGKQVP